MAYVAPGESGGPGIGFKRAEEGQILKQKKTDRRLVRLGPQDNALVLTANLPEGEEVMVDNVQAVISQALGMGHKIAARDIAEIAEGETVTKYGAPIGVATKRIPFGTHVHVHNVRSNYTASYVRPKTDECSQAISVPMAVRVSAMWPSSPIWQKTHTMWRVRSRSATAVGTFM